MRSIGEVLLLSPGLINVHRLLFKCSSIMPSYRGRVHRKNVPPRGERPAPDEVTHQPTNEICDLTGVQTPSNRAPFDLEMPPALGVEDGVASSASYNLRSKHTDLQPPTVSTAKWLRADCCWMMKMWQRCVFTCFLES